MAQRGGKPPGGRRKIEPEPRTVDEMIEWLKRSLGSGNIPHGHKNSNVKRWRLTMARKKKLNDWDRAKSKMDEAIGEIKTAVEHELPKGTIVDRRTGEDRRKKQKKGFFRGKVKW